MTDGQFVELSGEGNATFAARTGLLPTKTYTQTLVLYSDFNQSGCRLSVPITGTTASLFVVPLPTPTPVATPEPTETPKPQVTVKPVGSVKTGDGSLGSKRVKG
jgi:hypothetical protein